MPELDKSYIFPKPETQKEEDLYNVLSDFINDIVNDSLDTGIFALLAGRSGGQTLYGGTASGDDLTLISTSHATKGTIFLNDSAIVINENGGDYDLRIEGTGQTHALFLQGSDGYTGFNTSTPTEQVHITGNLFLNTDNDSLILGAGKDMKIYYDGTNGNIDTDLVAASDLVIDCGTEKTVVLEEPVYDDQQVNLFSVVKGSSSPTETSYKGGKILAFDKGQDNIIYFNAQLTHKYKSESNIEFHVHTTVPDNNTGDVVWVLTYSWADIGSDFPTETSATATQSIAANSQDEHLYFEIASAISGSGKTGVSSVLICSLMREGTSGDDDYNNDIYLTALDFHIQEDTLGSRQETVK